VGSTVDVAVTARYAEQPLVGAGVRATSDAAGLVLETPERTAGDDGVAVLRVRGEAVGEGVVHIALPAYPDADPVRLAVDVLPVGSEPPPTDPCAVNNGGCGAPEDGRCVVESGASRCVDLDACAADETGRNRCGVVGFVTCVDNELLGPDCADIDECAANPCGDPYHHRCENVYGAMHVCTPYEPCTPDANGETYCGPVAYVTCIDRPGAMPTCVDVDACAPGPDGRNACGAYTRWRCVDRESVAPDCEAIDACATNNGNCGPAEYFRCVDRVDETPECFDLDECAADNGGCGPRDLHQCTDRRGGPPGCSPRDLCAPDADLGNECGDARYWTCVGPPGTYPECFDRLECAVSANGRNGCPGLARASRCVERVGAAPDCLPCPEGFVNLDADPLTCEHACVPAGPEVCNGLDDDCDGRIDDAFDHRRDPENCGACGLRCGDAPGVATAACIEGACGALRCLPGLYDGDADPDNGCEAALPDDVLYVDAGVDDPSPDGTAAHPFRRIGDALAAGAERPERTIVVAAGVYAECVVLSLPNTRLLGAGADRVTLACNEPYALWVNAADGVLVSGLRLTTADQTYGFWAQGAADLVVSDVTVVGYVNAVELVSVQRASLRGLRIVDAGGSGASPRGLSLVQSTDVEVSGLEIEGVSLSTAGGGGVVIGAGCQRVRLDGVKLSGVTAQPGVPEATGLEVAGGVREVDVRRLRIERVEGGEAEPAALVPAGDAFGVLIGEGVEAVALAEVEILGIRGGRGGETPGGAAFGLAAARSNSLSLARVDVRDVEAGPGMPVGAATGLRLREATGGSVRNALVWQIRGGVGTPATGVSIDAAVASTFSAMTVAEIGAPDETEAVGVRIGDGQALSLRLEDMLVSGVRGRCLRAPVGGVRAVLGAALLHDCGAPPVEGPYESAGDLLTDDPRFRDRAAGNLHLAADSPAVDAAARASAFDREPAPNGGRADLGRYGNTSEATPSP
jgi:hypothetical protein